MEHQPGQPFRISPRSLCVAGVGCLVLFSLAWAQLSRRLIDTGPLVYPGGMETTTSQGWPYLFWVRHEFDDVFVPDSRSVTSSVAFGLLTLNVSVWLLMTLSSVHVARLVFSGRVQFSLRRMMAFWLVTAICIASWRTAYQALFEGPLSSFADSPSGRAFLLEDSTNPMLRLLTFSVVCKTGVLIGLACSVIVVLSFVSRLASVVVSLRLRMPRADAPKAPQLTAERDYEEESSARPR